MNLEEIPNQVIYYVNAAIVYLFGGFEAEMLSLAIYVVAMAAYGMIVYHYYRHLAKRDFFKVDFSKYREHTPKFKFLREIVDVIFYLIKYVIIFPIYTFIWFVVLSLFLLFLAKSQTIPGILLVSISIVAAARITAYHSEDLSKDMAKLIPFALLGVFIVDPTFFSMQAVIDRIYQIPNFIGLASRYLIFVIILEFFFRMLFELKLGLIKKDDRIKLEKTVPEEKNLEEETHGDAKKRKQ